MVRKLRPIDRRGMHAKPKIIEGGPFSGMVLKGVQKPLTKKQAEIAKRACEHYQRVLVKAGVPIVPAKTRIVGHGKTRRVYFIQGHLPTEKVLSNFFKKASKSQCMSVIKQLLSHVKKIMEYNKTHKEKLALDPNFENWVMVGNTPALIDFFPPRVKSRQHDRVVLYSAESRIFKLGHLLLWPLAVKRKYDPKKAVRVIIYDAIQLRPDLAEKILELGRAFVKENFSGRERSRLLKALSSKETLKKRSFLGAIATTAELRKRRKLERKNRL